MKLITDNKRLVSVFKNLCVNYSHYQWAVAWAGDTDAFELAKVLDKNEKKIDKIIVGLHFYQTSPKFIERYMTNSSVRFFIQTDGTFHSKVYLFYNSRSDWSVIIGSSNFTKHGFYNNIEANVLIDSNDNDISFKDITSYISSIWNNGKYFSHADLDNYKKAYKYQQPKHHSLKKIGLKKNTSSILELMTWEEYVHNILDQDCNFTKRLELLNKAQEIFAEGKSFDKLSTETKKALAGFITSTADLSDVDTDWRLFGSMKGAGEFKHAINNNIKIGKALDNIPLVGKISENQFNTYCSAFAGWKNPIACATRLLAIKRPDFFVCVNSKNKKELARLLNIPQSKITLENYWDEVLTPIHESVWFNDQISQFSKQDKDIKKCQVAMLDSISYYYEQQ